MTKIIEEQLFAACQDYSESQKSLLLRAIDVAKSAHDGQIRKSSGSPYVIHPLEVAHMLQQKFDDFALTVSAVLHDTVEDSDHVTMEHIYQTFGPEIGFIVDAVTKTELTFHASQESMHSYVEKLMLGGLQDARCFLLKLADRDNNMLTLSTFRSQKQHRISFETQALFAPLRVILGYDREENSIKNVHRRFTSFLTKKKLSTPQQLESYLFDYSFLDFNRETFEQVYSCAENIVWEIRDYKNYQKLCKNEYFDECVQVLSLETDGENFRVKFKFKALPPVMEQNITKFSVSTFSA